MILIFVDKHDVLDFLSNELPQSPEDFLIYLEEKLEAGELTIDEVAQLMRDFNSSYF
ncbi:MAG: hypothetical protein KatS3mg015_2639 [Fimbriimonadales bacterium]|nr:MAG: hypothetical protein KatS3mg015_2639 [Fimbriimonadales bacterium]